MEEPLRYADVARAHGRTIPDHVLGAAQNEHDPQRRVLAQLSARLTPAAALPLTAAATLQQKGDISDRNVAFSRPYLVTPPGLEPGISA